MSSMATQVAEAAAAAVRAAAAAAGSSSGDIESELRRVADNITSVEAEQKLVKDELNKVKDALSGKHEYSGMTGELLADFLRHLMKKEESLMKEKEQLRDKEARLERQQVTGEEIVCGCILLFMLVSLY